MTRWSDGGCEIGDKYYSVVGPDAVPAAVLEDLRSRVMPRREGGAAAGTSSEDVIGGI